RHTRFSRDWSSDVCSSDLKGSKDAELQDERPLLYQGGSDSLVAANAPIIVPEDDLAVDFEAEVVVITAHVPMRPTKDEASAAIRSEERRVGRERRARWGAC